MRYYIIFGVTLVLVLLIIFCTPYLGTYKNKMTIDYQDIEVIDGYKWEYETKDKELKVTEKSENKWVFKPVKSGKYEITFTYKNEEDTKYTIYYKFYVLGKRIFWTEGNAKGLLNYSNPY